MSKNNVILSGIQPTGKLHFGRYFGAVENWIQLQESYDCLYMIANYHAITMPFTSKKLAEQTWDLCFNLLACGIKAENLFIQSLVPEHVEMGWLLGCFTSYGQLTRMTQFKDKSSRKDVKEDFISAGLFTYPALQAADILIYKAGIVPVGKDQEQHLELTRDIAQRFNNFAGTEFFPVPEALYTKVPKVMSTADPLRKMSASMGPKHHIDIFAEEAVLRKQIRSAVTDTGEVDGNMSAGVSNLFQLLLASGKQEAYTSLMTDYKNQSLKYSDLKQAVADGLVDISSKVRERLKELKSDRRAVKNQIKQSSFEIRKRAQETTREAKEICGLMNVKI